MAKKRLFSSATDIFFFFEAKKQQFFSANVIFYCGKEKKTGYPILLQKNISFAPKNYYFFAAKNIRLGFK